LSKVERIPGILRVYDPAPAHAVPLLVDSPHSGTHYPKDFNFTCDKAELERYEDRAVDQLVTGMADLGATVVCAEIARSYLDLNRSTRDMLPGQFRNSWTGETLKPDYARRGIGLVWTTVDSKAIYHHPPTAAAVQKRINTYYKPYYAALEHRAQRLRDQFGKFWHLNMHSMHPNMPQDIILGTLEGESCSEAFAGCVEDALRAQGLFRVAKNFQYKGANLTTLFGKPHEHSESMQIEINKRLYLKDDLLTIDPEKFARLKDQLENLCKMVGNYAAAEVMVPKTPLKDALSAASTSSIEARVPSAAIDVTP